MDQPRANRLRPITAAILPLLLSLLVLSHPGVAADKTTVVMLISQAKEKQEQARDRQHAWSATADYIARAQTLLGAGDLELAEAMAKRAIKAADASLQQAADEAGAWQARVPTL